MKNCLALLLMTAAFALASLAQTPAAHDGSPALKFSRTEGQRNLAYFVEYVQYGTEPAFRIRVHHYHAWCNGYLYITPSAVAYLPELTPGQKDGVSIRRNDVQSFTPRAGGAELRLGNKSYQFAFLSSPDSPSHGAQLGATELLKFITLAYSDFPAAQRQFLTTVAGLRSSAPPATPEINLLSPAGVAPNATVAAAPRQPMLGIVSASGGVTGVAVNGQASKLIPLSKEIAAFQAAPVASAAGNDVTIAATAADGNQSSLAFHVIKPEIRFVSPAPGSRTRDEKVTLQGTITGMRDVQFVEIAGKRAALTPRQDGSYEFRLADFPLALGPNVISGFADQANGERSTFDVSVLRAPPLQPLTLDAIERALKNAVSPVRIQALVDDQGVDFELTPEVEKRLRAEGAPKTLLDAIADAHSTGPH